MFVTRSHDVGADLKSANERRKLFLLHSFDVPDLFHLILFSFILLI